MKNITSQIFQRLKVPSTERVKRHLKLDRHTLFCAHTNSRNTNVGRRLMQTIFVWGNDVGKEVLQPLLQQNKHLNPTAPLKQILI